MASFVSIYELQTSVKLHVRPAGIRADCRQFAANAHVRLACREDVPHVLTLLQQQADYHGVPEKCVATQANLEAGLFDSACCSQAQPFLFGPTVLFLELSPSSFASPHNHELSTTHFPYPSLESAEIAFLPRPAPYPAKKSDANSNGHTRVAENSAANSLVESLRDGHGIAHKFMLPELIKDPHALAFQSAEGRIIAGFAFIFQKYISFEAKHGIYIEDLFVREGMRGYGFGTVLFKSVARLAVELECGAVEFRVTDWNKGALKLYESLGVKVSPEWKTCSLSGYGLETCGSSTSIFADVGKSPKIVVPQTLQPNKHKSNHWACSSVVDAFRR